MKIKYPAYPKQCCHCNLIHNPKPNGKERCVYVRVIEDNGVLRWGCTGCFPAPGEHHHDPKYAASKTGNLYDRTGTDVPLPKTGSSR